MIALLCLVASAAKPTTAASCSAYASGIVFGTTSGNRVDVTGTITVTCTNGTPYNIGLNAGNTPGATIDNREMFGGSGGQNTLGYQLFSDAARTINWGNSAGTNWVSGIGNGAAQPYTLYARIPALQATQSGSYTDTITASITGGFTTATAQFSVTATAVPGCAIAATDLEFGDYTGVPINTTSVITVICSAGARFDIGLNAGTASGATVMSRSMTGPRGAVLGYNLFQDARRSQNWGNTPGLDTESGNGSGRAGLFLVYGQLPGGQSAPQGAYTDTITATVTF
jgi:spore coat protein U-like protein